MVVQDKSVALVFPGQGAQYVGMGKEFYDSDESLRVLYGKASDILGFDLAQTIFAGTEDGLKQTQVTQPAVFMTSLAIMEALKKALPSWEKKVLCTAGHSLGEYSALVTSGVLAFEEGMKLVSKRGEFIGKASQLNPGTMAAVLGMGKDAISALCEEITSSGSIVEPVNFNTAEQIVVAGTVDGMELFEKLAPGKGAKRVIRLAVSGPFHSSLMTPAAELLDKVVIKAVVNDAVLPVVTNCDAVMTTAKEEFRTKMVRQVNHPVFWENSVKTMISAGVRVFIEIGPGKIIGGLIKKISREIIVLNAENTVTLKNVVEQLSI
ncbi:MAG: ACP S-malonyltransferase [Elusimicrobiota bacterium]